MKDLEYKIKKLNSLSSLLNSYISDNEQADKEFILREIEEIELIAKEIAAIVSDRPLS